MSIKSNSDTEFEVFISRYSGNSLNHASSLSLFLLDYVWHDKYGFNEYSIKYNPVNSFDFDSVWNSISVHVYRLFKNLFHKHKFHKKTEHFVTVEKIFYYKSQINLNSTHLERFHEFYMVYIASKLDEYRNFLMPKIEKKHNLNYQFKIIVSPFKDDLKYLRKYTNDKYEITKYLRILKSVKHSKNEHFQEIVSDIERLKSDMCDIYNARRATNSVTLGYIGFFIGIISMGYTIFTSIYNNDSEKINKIDSLQNIHNKASLGIEKCIEKFHKEDSLDLFKLNEKVSKTQDIIKTTSQSEKDEIIKELKLNNKILIQRLNKYESDFIKLSRSKSLESKSELSSKSPS